MLSRRAAYIRRVSPSLSLRLGSNPLSKKYCIPSPQYGARQEGISQNIDEANRTNKLDIKEAIIYFVNNGIKMTNDVLSYFVRKRDLEMVKFLLDNGHTSFLFDKYYDNFHHRSTNLIGLCGTYRSEECKDLIARYTWKEILRIERNNAQKLSRGGMLKEVVELILLNKKQQELCSNLQNEKNKEILKYFAMELEIPITSNMTKSQLCYIISRTISRRRYSAEHEENEKRIDDDIKKLIRGIALRAGLDPNKPTNDLLLDLSYIYKEK